MNIEKTFALAVKNHRENNLDVAIRLYNQIIEIDPNYLNAHNNLGNIFQELGDTQRAIGFFEKVIEIDPNYIFAYYNLGLIFKKLGDLKKTINYYKKIIEINSEHTAIHNNLGIIYADLGEHKKAISCYEKVIEIDPNNLDAHYNLGTTFNTIRDYQKAKDCYEKAIKIDPNNITVLNKLGIIQRNNFGHTQKALSYFKKVIEIDPNNLDAHSNIAHIYISELDNFDKAINISNKVLKMHHINSKFVNQCIPLFRLKHDVQQAQYLSSKNYKVEGVNEFQKIGRKILDREENKEDEENFNKKILLTQNEISGLLPFYKSNHIYQPKEISGSYINPNKNWQDVEDEYFNSSKQIIYIDDFLSIETLQELREFCLVSKVWNKEYYNPFLGAYAEKGFISLTHLKIAIELQQKLPKLFGQHKLGNFWGFKYDSTLGKGINIHADFAIHNLNFWITPDEYNNNKNSGGLKVYDAPAPENWTFKDYNTNGNKIYKFLKDNNANCTNIPYKFNRAVLFNSAYFHETDEIDFKDEYEGRRINMTYLFGTRLKKINNIDKT